MWEKVNSYLQRKLVICIFIEYFLTSIPLKISQYYFQKGETYKNGLYYVVSVMSAYKTIQNLIL